MKNFYSFFLFFTALLSYSQITVTLPVGTGSWIVPCGVTSITVQAWGGGGGGGGSSISGSGGSGGGSGGYSTGIFAVVPGSSIPYTVGTGGARGSSNSGAGGNGGSSIISGISANGGTGGAGNRGLAGIGGSATGGTTNTNGSNGTVGAASGGAGGTAPGGGAGGSGTTNTDGGSGNTPGGGGGGGEAAVNFFIFTDPKSGGAGGNGEIKITYTVVPPAAPAVSNITHNSATLSWTGTGSYLVEYGAAGYTPGTAASAGAGGMVASASATSPFIVTGLNAGTAYDFYIRSINCPTTGQFGINSAKASATTLLAPCPAPTSRPTNLIFSGITSAQLSGNFTGSSPAASGYLVIRSAFATVSAPVNGVVYTGNALGGTVVSNGSSLSFTDTGLAGNTRYYYTVFPYTSAATCSGSPVYLTTTPLQNNAVTCAQPPTAPGATAITTNGVNLSWTASPAGGAGATISYVLEISTDNFATLVSGYPVNNGTLTSRMVTGLSPTTAYQYRIKANNGCDSPYIVGTFTTLCAAPNAPTNLSGTATTTTANGSFNAVAGAAGYLVLRSTTATPPGPINGTSYTVGSSLGGATVISSGAGTTIADSGLTPNTLYHYFAFSYNSGICSNGPVYSTSYLSGSITTCPLPPTLNTVTSITQTSATIGWTAPVGGTAPINYIVEVSTNASFSPQITESPFSGAATSRNLSGLVAGTTYYYRIKANSGCDSTWLSASFSTLCATPLPAGSVSLSLTGGTVTGTIAAPATTPGGYLILRSTSPTAPILINAQIYNTASNFSGNYVVRGSNTAVNTITFTDVPAGYVYYYVYSLNSGCSGGPVYSSAVSGRINACAPSSPTAARYISEVKFMGTLSADTSNVTGFTAGGYTDYTALPAKAKQIPGGVVNMNVKLSGTADPPTGVIRAWVDWNKDGIFDEPAEKEYDTEGYLSPNVVFGFIVPATTTPGLYTIRIRAGIQSAGVTPCGAANDNETEDYSFEVIGDCSAKIISVVNGERCGSGSVTLTATGSAETTSYRWYRTEFGPAIAGENSSTYITESLVKDEVYYVAALSGSCESAVRVPVKVKVRPVPAITFTQNSPDFCGAANTVVITSSGNREEVTLLEEKFEGSLVTLGAFKNEIGGYPAADGFWKPQPSPFEVGTPYNVIRVALSSGFNGGNFANIITDVKQTSDLTNYLVTTNPINTVGISKLKIDFDLYYFAEEDNKPLKNKLSVEYSINGNDWYPLKTYASTIGVPSRFEHQTVEDDIADPKLENQTNLKLRFSVFALGRANGQGAVEEWIGTVAAIDNVRVYGEKELPAKFIWSGTAGELLDSTCSTPVDAAGAPSVCVKLSEYEIENRAQILVTASAALTNGCSTSGTFTINNSSKIWNDAGTNWAATNWKPAAAIPTANNCVLVKQPVIIGAGTDGLARNITIMPGGKLNIEGSLKVTDAVVNQRSADYFVVESDGGLIQVNEGNAINTGNITAKRNINVSAGRQQYNYIISPTEGQSLKTIYNGIDVVLYHNEATGFFYNSSGAYIKGRALAVKEPKGTGAKAVTVATFVGYPTNGEFTHGIVNSNPTHPKRGYNLVGNPYPSNMDLLKFYEINGGAAGTLSSSFHLWDNRANSQTVQMGDKYLGQAYAVYNAFDDTGTLAFGDEGFGGTHRPTRYIPVGQGFMLKTSARNQQLIFNNTVRTEKSGTVAFFGKEAATKDRYWINMVTPQNLASNIAVVYFENGNNALGKDDSPSLGGSDEVYSVVENEKIVINGRSPFTNTDVVPLGTRHYTGGQYRLTLAAAEGVFANGQPVYLKDKQNGTIANLSEGDYVFSASAGESTGRFEIVYKPGGVLSADSTSADELIVFRDGGDFVVRSASKKITGLQLFDSSGRLIFVAAPNAKEALIDGSSLVNGGYILKIDRGGETTTRKVIK